MNILFLMKAYDIGGIEVVAATLADSFVKHGHKVAITTFKAPDAMMVARTNPEIQIYTIGKFECSAINADRLRKILIADSIDVVINQWGLPYIPCKVLNKAKKGLNIKTIAVYHNQIDTNARIKNVEIAIASTHNPLKRILLNIQKMIVRQITSASMRYVYHHSDIYQVLSPCYEELFKRFTGIKNPRKLMVQTNPVTVNSSDYHYSQTEKQKEIIYMGRIDYNQKRVYRVIDTWALLESEYSDWRLTIIGDGIERKNIEQKVRDLKLKHVSFEGFQKPEPYYKRASLLLLASEYEGFPLVLAECMSYGVVPIVYDSYSAVKDIVDNHVNGITLPYHPNGYDAKEAAQRISEVMKNDLDRKKMALAAIDKSKCYSIENIYNEWEQTFNSMKKEKCDGN